MIQNYKCNKIKIKCSEFSHTIDATFLKIRSALSHAFIAKCFRSEISLDPHCTTDLYNTDQCIVRLYAQQRLLYDII